MNDGDKALVTVLFSVIGFFEKEGLLNRERLIDYLLEVRSAPVDAGGPVLDQHNEGMDLLIQMIENTQFPRE